MNLKNRVLAFSAAFSLILFALPGYLIAQTTSIQPLDDPFKDPCTGNTRNDLAAAEACRKKAEEQGRSLGYDISCKTETLGYVVPDFTGYSSFYFNNCTINGEDGFWAEALAGFKPSGPTSGGMSGLGSGWWIVPYDLSTQSDFFSSYNPYSNPYSSGLIISNNTNTRPINNTTSNYASLLLQQIYNITNNLKSQLMAINSNSSTNGTSSGLNTSNSSTFTSTSQPKTPSYISMVEGRSQIDGQVSFSSEKCVIFTKSNSVVTVGNTGSSVLALRYILNNNGFPEAGSGGQNPDVFDYSMFRALSKYQASNNISGNPLNSTYGNNFYSTGVLDNPTREFLNSKCYKINS